MRRTPNQPAAEVAIIPAADHERIAPDGPIASVQTAQVHIPAEALEQMWRPEMLERLARAYWEYLRRRSLGLIRVRYGETDRTVVLAGGLLTLLRFRAPEYSTGPDFGRVTWPIDRGLLVARRGRGHGYLRIEVRQRDPETLLIAAEVANYYPLLRGSGRFARIGAWLYGRTQMRLHVMVAHGFLRSLATLDLPPLRSGRESGYAPPAGEE